MTVQLNVAEVVTPTQHIYKSIATLEDGKLTVKDRRSGRVLFERDAPVHQVSSSEWTYGEDVTVKKQTVCGCGGTRVTER